MQSHLVDTQVSNLTATPTCEWMQRLIALLDAAVLQLQEHAVHSKLLEAASLLRKQFDPDATPKLREAKGCLLAWQARKVREYIDAHIADPILVSDLCALVQRSEAHFSRSFKRTFGESSHTFVLRRRLELAAECMLQTDAPLSDLSLQCGFVDQAHLCRHFRQWMGQTPAAWRRARKTGDPATIPSGSRPAAGQRMPSARARVIAPERFLTSSLL